MIVAMLLSINTFAQVELLGTADGQVSRLTDNILYDIVQTDQYGKVLATIEPKETSFFIYSDSLYSLLSITQIYNGCITSNAGDYDYWLVERTSNVDPLVYPNPTTGQLFVALNVLSEDLFVSIYDIQLRQMVSQKLTDFISTVNISSLSEGTYLLDIRNKNQTFKTTKICLVKNK